MFRVLHGRRSKVFLFSRLSRRLLLAALFGSGSGLAVSNRVGWLDLDPARQSAYVSLNADLGFPIGAKELTLAVDCAAPGVRAYPKPASGVPMALKEWKADPGLLAALIKAGFVTQKAGTVTLKDTDKRQTLVMACDKKVLTTNFSGIDNIGGAGIVGAPFFRGDGEPTVNLDYALIFFGGSHLVNFSVQQRVTRVPQGYAFSRLQVDADAPTVSPKAQVFMSDGEFLYPLYYNGQPQANAQLGKVVIARQVDLYVSEDPAKGGWRRTSYDYATQVLRTDPVPKPNLPIRQ